MESYLWLKNSKTYQSINGDDSEDITEHVKHLCQPVINGPSDVAQILGAIQYWDVYEIPANIILYFATHLICSDDIIYFEIEKEWLDLFTKLFYLYNIPKCIDTVQFDGHDLYGVDCDNFNFFKSCVRMDFYRVFVSSLSTEIMTPKMKELIKLACYVGNLDCFQYIVLNTKNTDTENTEYDYDYMIEACLCSITGKNVNCLKYARDQYSYNNKKNVDQDRFIQYSYEIIMIFAACCGHLEGLIYVLEQHPQTHVKHRSTTIYRSCIYAAENGHLYCLKFLHAKGSILTTNIATMAAGNGHLGCLRYLHENNCPWNADTCCAAATNGHLACLRFLHENNCPWNADTFWAAATNGHLACLQYLHENGCAWSNCTIKCGMVAMSGHFDCLLYLYKNVFNGV